MTGYDFTRWMASHKLNVGAAAEALGVGRNTIPRYMKEGAPKHIGLACAAISMGLPEWKARD